MTAPLAQKTVLMIQDRVAQGHRFQHIASELGVSESAVGRRARALVEKWCDCGKKAGHIGQCQVAPDPDEAWRNLCGAVIKQAHEDAATIRQYQERDPVTPHDHKRQRRARDVSCPFEFFDSEWFDYLCHTSGARPDRVRGALRTELGEW